MNTQRAVKRSFYTVMGMTIFLLAACGHMPNTAPAPDASPVLEPQSMGWVQLGGSVTSDGFSLHYGQSLVLDSSGHPVVSWSEGARPFTVGLIKRWNGSTWEMAAESLSDLSSDPKLALNSLDEPVALFAHCLYFDNNIDSTRCLKANLYVRRWNRQIQIWESIGDALNITPSRHLYPGSIALDSSDQPVVSYQEDTHIYVKRWNAMAGRWIDLGEAINPNPVATDYSSNELVLDSRGNPVIVWNEPYVVGDSSQVYVKRWNENSLSWESFGSVGTPLNVEVADYATYPSLALDPSDYPVVSWYEASRNSNNQKIQVKRWDGSNWQLLTGTLTVESNRVGIRSSVAVDALGNPMVMWTANNGPSSQTYVKHWDSYSNRWTLIGTSLGQSIGSNMAVDNSGNPVVSLHENPGFGLVVKHYTDTTGSDLQELNFDPCVYRANCITPRVFVRIPPRVCWVCNFSLNIPYENPYRLGFSLPELGLDPEKFAQVFAVKLLSNGKVIAEGTVTTQDNGNGKEAVLELSTKLSKGNYSVQLDILDKDIAKLLHTTGDKYPFTFSMEVVK